MMDDIGNMWQDKGIISKLRTGPGRVAVLYVVGLIVCIVAGLASPDLFISKKAVFSSPDPDAANSASSVYEFDISDYKRSHQSIHFSMRLNAPIQLQNAMELNDRTSYETEGQYAVAVYGSQQPFSASENCPNGCLSCPDGDDALGLTCDLISGDVAGEGTIACERGVEWCSWLSLYSVNFVSHKTYYWRVETENDMDKYIEAANPASYEEWDSEFRVVFVSRWYTGFELAWFYCWLFLTLLVMFLPRHGFFALAIAEGSRWSVWSNLQKWVAVLLIGLFFFNNPFVAAQIYSQSPKSCFIWYALAEGLFVTLLLLFWAARIFDAGHGQNGSRVNAITARAAAVVLGVLLCVVYVINMIEIRISSDDNPEEAHNHSYPSSAAEGVLTVLCLIYCAWIVALAARAWWWGGKMPEKLRSSRRVQFFAVSSLVTILLLFPAVILEHLQPRVRGGAAFTLARGSVNLYVMALAVLCAPRHPDDKTYDDDEDIGTTVNPMAHQRAVEVVEGQGAADRKDSGRWWKGKQRPKIRDSSIWEDDMAEL